MGGKVRNVVDGGSRLLERVRDELAETPDIREQRMFGGHCFLYRGHMVGGTTGDGRLVLRVGAQAFESVLAKPHAAPMDFTGRPMRGFVYIDPAGMRTAGQLREWLGLGMAYASSLPPK